MIFVQPAYLPSVNYFKDFNDNDLVYNINLGLDESDYFDETYMSNENGAVSYTHLTLPTKRIV